jgi:hypothetical protein
VYGLYFGTKPDLWATHDGGLHWEQPDLPGVPGDSVSDVEATAGLVSASFDGFPNLIATSPVGKDDWTLSSTTRPMGAGGAPSEQIVLQGSVGWLIAEERGVLGGARLFNRSWVPWNPPCREAFGHTFLAASDATHLVAVCDTGVFTDAAPSTLVYFSHNGGSSFDQSNSLPQDDFGPIANPAPGVVIIASSRTSDLLATFNGGATWTVVSKASGAEEWQEIGFVTPDEGEAVSGNGGLFMTFDGGRHWSRVNVLTTAGHR